ncbi:MAG TPA: hypothetical protein VGE07_09585 [Herpetosiphonaceae bacterium]
MRGKGINYDTGFFHKSFSRDFDPAVVGRELQIIREDLHCTAVRITGGDPDRLEQAALLAAAAGLEVWFSPFTCNLDPEEMLDLLADCAGRAERLRQSGAEVVLVLGAEISLLNNGFMPGATISERIKLLTNPPQLRAAIAVVPPLINAFLGRAAARVRAHFGGKITYAAMPFEQVDWAPFDIISLDMYRTAAVAEQFPGAMRTLAAQDKPVAITEFGAVTFRGGAALGANAIDAVAWDDETGKPTGLNGDFVRDEAEQAAEVGELLAIFDEAGIDSAFVFTFVQYALVHRPDGGPDLDMAAYSIVKTYEDRRGATYPDMAWEPKAAFAAVAAAYRP